MAAGSLQPMIRQLRHLLRPGASGGLVDADLLQRFVTSRDEAAFEVLLWRHGPMVLGVCRRLLPRKEDIEDAFQATFLALARKAGSIAQREAVASWLYKVAYRIALDARTRSARVAAHEKLVPILPAVASSEDVPQQVARRELHGLLDAEIQRLPRKYREAVVLCYLEGKTQEEAAQELGWAKGTVSTRLIHARELLRRRLQRHGAAFSATALLPALAHQALPSLVKPTLRAVLSSGAPNGASLVSAKALVLANGVLHTMAATKWKIATLLLVVVTFVGTGGGWLGYQASQAEPVTPPTLAADERPNPSPASPLGKLDANRIPAEDRAAWQPAELVAILGEQRGRHWGAVLSAAFSPDGQQIASCGEDLVIRLWDAATLRERAVLEQHTRYVRSLSFSPDGKMLASAADDRTWVLWDLQMTPPKARAVLKRTEGQPVLAFSPRRNLLATTGPKGSIRLWDVAGEQAPQEVFLLDGPQDWLHSLAFSSDGKTLASGSVDGTVVLWDVASRMQKAIVPTNLRSVRSLAFSPDGKTLAAVAEDFRANRYSVTLWDVSDRERPQEQAVLDRHTHQVFAVRFSPDGKMLASAGADGTVRLSNLTGAAPIEQAVIQVGSWITSLDFSRDGRTLITADRNCMVRCWDLTGPAPTERFAHQGHLDGVSSVALARNGLLASVGRTVRLWDLGGPQAKERYSLAGAQPIALSRDGKILACDQGGGTLEVWDLGKDKPTKRWQCQTHRLPGVRGIGSLEISADGETLVSCGVDNKIRFWDLTANQPKERYHIEAHAAECVLAPARAGTWPALANFGPNFNRTDPAIAQAAKTVRLWDLTGPKPIENAVLEQPQDVASVAFAPDGKTLATGGGGFVVNQDPPPPGEVRLWRLSDEGPQKGFVLLDGPATTMDCVVYSPDGQILAAAGRRGQVILWEMATRQKCCEWQFPGPIARLAFSLDGRHLITANANGTLYVLRLGQGVPAAVDGAKLWDTLATADAAGAYPIIWGLVAAPERALALFKGRLQPIEARAPLLDDATPIPPDRLRTLRAIQVLEQIGNRDAQQLLKRLAQGAPKAREMQQAHAALQRLAERSAALP